MFGELRRGRRGLGILNSEFWILNSSLCFLLVLAAGASAQLQPCAPDPDCIVIVASSPPGVFSPDDEVPVSVTFRSALDDGRAGGADEIAAVSLSLAIAGLELADCGSPDANGLTAAFTLAPEVAENFVLFVENTRCLARSDCLCPRKGQGRDFFINLVVSPRAETVPPPKAPVLPDGELFSVQLRVRHEAPSTVRLHVFSEVDDPVKQPKPEFAGFVTAGDRLAVDQTAERKLGTSRIRLIDGQLLVAGGATPTSTASATRTGTATASVTATASATHTVTPGPSPTSTNSPTVTPTTDPNATPTATATVTVEVTATVTPSETVATTTPTIPPPVECLGDCDGDGAVRIDELVTAVTIGLELEAVAECQSADRDHNLLVSVDELIRAVRAALQGCPS